IVNEWNICMNKGCISKCRKRFTVEPNNARMLVSNAASNIEKLLSTRSRALKVRDKAAEKAQVQHQWTDNLENETDPVLLQNRTKPDFRADPVFKRHVSFNHTAVHIPTDIYEGSTIVLNELNWTDALQETFKKNREEDPTLLWQVFGSATGLARYYPASPWIDKEKTPNNIDLYDVRRRPWYIQGAASPKDMLILVDASGSVSGLTLKLIRTSVNEMLETLSDDDYVNVVYFNEKAMQAACFGHLVQANVRNKKILKDAVQNISAKGITNYKMGFELAFEQLLSFNMTRANCNKIIMLFTDGGEERASEIFEKYNYHKRVRIFTFSVGQHNYDKAPIQWMACTNKGYYYEIPSIGAIRINTQEYLDVLGRPMVQAKEAQKVQWTNVYLDALELGLVITGTLPVFNKTTIKDENNREKQQNQLILGVMAIDVSLEDIKRLTPRFTLGPNGYYFAIDPNGYVFLHPNLLPKNPKFQEPVTLDFLDAELEDSNKVQKYIDIGHRTYTWSPVNETDYSLALVLPDYSLHYIHATIGDTITQAKFFESLQVENFEENGYTYIAPREYCKDLKPSVNHTEFLMNFTEYIDRNTPNHPMCDIMTRFYCSSVDRNEKVAARFVATDGGITRVYPSSAGSDWFELENPETYESSFYKRSLDNDGYIFTPRFSDNGEGLGIVRAVHLNVDGINLKPAGNLLIKCCMECWCLRLSPSVPAKCKDEICGCRRNDKNVDCVLLDDGGFLVMSNQDDHISRIGEFFGMIDPSLMIELVNTSLFTLTKSYDYQSLCERKTETRAAAGLRSVYVPTIADILNVGWWASAAHAGPPFLWSWVLVLATDRHSISAAEPDEDLSDAHSKESCITEQTQYYFNDTEGSYSGTMGCDACSRQYLVEKLLKTNLVFIIAEVSCKSCPVSVLSQAEKPSSGPDPCELALNPRYRKGPDVCFDNNANASRTSLNAMLLSLSTLPCISHV
uniref:VWFA domain-containing protein n=1 Tax=Denticeps clupeoides TaxID=299321 RepID=A0AAY4E7K4_9TELE